jgi:cation transport regulator ChaB
MSLYCEDGALADIRPGADRCRRESCHKVAVYHHVDPPVVRDALDRAIYAAAFVAAMQTYARRPELPSETLGRGACDVAEAMVEAHRSARTR